MATNESTLPAWVKVTWPDSAGGVKAGSVSRQYDTRRYNPYSESPGDAPPLYEGQGVGWCAALLPLQATGLERGRLGLEVAVSSAVAEVDPESNHQPHRESDPRIQRQREHQAQTGKNAEQRDQGDERRPERPLQIGARVPQDPHAGAHQHEREQRADVDPGAKQLQRQEPGGEAHGDAGIDRGQVGRAETRMDLTGPGPEQAS